MSRNKKPAQSPAPLGWRLQLRVLKLRLGSYVLPSWAAREAEDIFLIPKKIPRPESEREFFESARKSELIPGVASYEWGIAGNPRVGLFHGWAGRGTQLGAFASPLVAKGFHVIAVDAPAHGMSSGKKLHVGLYAHVMLDLEKKLGPFYAVAGHSFGAGCAVVAAYWGLKVQKLVLIAGPAKYSRVVELFFKRTGISKATQKRFLQNLQQMVGLHSEEIDIANLGSKISAEKLIVHDLQDSEVLYRSALEMHEVWPKSKLLTTEGLGHRRILKDPKVISAVVEFLGKPTE